MFRPLFSRHRLLGLVWFGSIFNSCTLEECQRVVLTSYRYSLQYPRPGSTAADLRTSHHTVVSFRCGNKPDQVCIVGFLYETAHDHSIPSRPRLLSVETVWARKSELRICSCSAAIVQCLHLPELATLTTANQGHCPHVEMYVSDGQTQIRGCLQLTSNLISVRLNKR